MQKFKIMPNYFIASSIVVLMLLFESTPTTTAKALTKSYNCSQPPKLNNFNINSCCRMPEISMGNVPKKCAQYVNSMRNQKNAEYLPAVAHVCYAECIYRETSTLQQGKVHLPSVRQFLQNHVNQRDKDSLSHIVVAFESCLTSFATHKEQLQSIEALQSKLPFGCSPYSSLVFGCVNVEIFSHCPAKLWQNDENCNVARDFIQECDKLPHVPMPPK